MGSISLRRSIRWIPDEASEPTSTIVVTSPGHWFVDIRVFRPKAAPTSWPEEEERLSPEDLEWAIAGTSSSTPIGEGPNSHGVWRHWIDSQTTDAENVVDEGDNYPQPDGTTLEIGRMLNPDTGKIGDYEEVWASVEPTTPVGSSPNIEHIVLQLDSGDSKGLVVLLGQYCQGFMRQGSNVTAERWEWSSAKSWKRTVVVGKAELPCSKVLLEPVPKVGARLTISGLHWDVIESSS